MASSLPSKPSAFGLLPEAFVRAPNDPGYVFERIQRIGTWVDGRPDLGRAAQAFLDAEVDLAMPEVVATEPSEDGATKFVVRFADGRSAECVHMPRNVREPRVTLCISSQVGCGMGCTFCATARMGFIRQLTAAEMVAQVLVMLQRLGPHTLGRTTLVFMGMGEPLQNLDEVLQTVRVLSHVRGLGIAPSRMTVSTSGLAPQIAELGRASPRPQLALSLNATTDASRSALMPVGHKYSLADLDAALRAFPFRPHEKLLLEYVLLAGRNDTLDDAVRLAAFARPFRHNVNVIPWNGFEGTDLRRPDEAATARFVNALRAEGVFVTVRNSRGRDVAAACGQLLRQEEKRRRRLPTAPRTAD